MKVTYTGQQEKFAPAQIQKLTAKLHKLAKLLDNRGGEREAHIILTSERHLRRAEITVQLHDHPMVGVAAEADQFTAILQAAEKLEKQVLKLQAKKRDVKREPKLGWQAVEPAAGPAAVAAEAPEGKVFRVNEHASRKPMTLEEAVLEMDAGRDYVVYVDAETDRVAVLIRRRDGHLDLVEA